MFDLVVEPFLRFNSHRNSRALLRLPTALEGRMLDTDPVGRPVIGPMLLKLQIGENITRLIERQSAHQCF